MAPHLTLDDVARDPFRLQFFLNAFGDEREALGQAFAFLSHVRQYKRLTGDKPALVHLAQEIVSAFLTDVSFGQLCESSKSVRTQRQHVVSCVLAQYCPLNLFSGLEDHVTWRLEHGRFPQFINSEAYTELGDALRARRDLPLGEILVHERRTQFLARFLQREDPAAIGNLRFWVDVQTVFLPLLQKQHVAAVSLFEEIQATLRRIFNLYLTETSPSAASRISDAVRKATLKKIVALQGEPFAPPGYANVYRAAQDVIWTWLQMDIYPRFRASPFYVMLVVETENLESDHQLRRLSEHVQNNTVMATRTASHKKSSTIVVPVPTSGKPSETWKQRPDAAYERVLNTNTMSAQHVKEISFHSVSVAASKTPVGWGSTMHHSLWCGAVDSDAVLPNTLMNFCWNKQVIVSYASALSPSHRALRSTPKSTLHEFVLPRRDGSLLYGVCLTRWHSHEPAHEPTDTSDAESNLLYVPSFICALASQPMHRTGRWLVQQLAAFSADEIPEETVAALMAALARAQLAWFSDFRLDARYGGFALTPAIVVGDSPLTWILNELSAQTVIAVLASLLVGKSLVLVSERPSALTNIGHALRELLQPFQWPHIFLPFCPLATAKELVGADVFSSDSKSPFIVGFEGGLVHQKHKEVSSEQRHRIRNSLYNVHRVSIQLQLPELAPPLISLLPDNSYPVEILQSAAIVFDIDSDDLYVPDRVEIPEFPRTRIKAMALLCTTLSHRVTQLGLVTVETLVRTLEGALKDLVKCQQVSSADSQFFRQPSASRVQELMGFAHDSQSIASSSQKADCRPTALAIDVRLTFLWFLESLFGDVVFHVCSVHPQSAASPLKAATDEGCHQQETCLIFEADSFLDARMELGCREFFRQCFDTDLFRLFLLRQHQLYAIPHDTDAGQAEETM